MRKKFKPLFSKNKKVITREELVNLLKKDRGVVPGFPGRRLMRPERMEIEREIFKPKKYGGKIKDYEFKKAINRLSAKKFKLPPEKAEDLERKIRYLRKISGL